MWQRATTAQLARHYGRSTAWVRRQLDQVSVSPKPASVEQAVAVIDATFWGRGYGVLVCRCPRRKQNLHWQEISTETVAVYRQARAALEARGCRLQAVVFDGRKGVRQVFADLPIQQCHFHQMATITRYLTRRPKLPAGQALRHIMLGLPEATEAVFVQQLAQWHQTWEAFINERTLNPLTGRRHYTHRRLRSAYRSLKLNRPYLFTYQAFPELGIPNTTNGLEGAFSHLKHLILVHRGLKPHRRLKLIHEILNR